MNTLYIYFHDSSMIAVDHSMNCNVFEALPVGGREDVVRKSTAHKLYELKEFKDMDPQVWLNYIIDKKALGIKEIRHSFRDVN